MRCPQSQCCLGQKVPTYALWVLASGGILQISSNRDDQMGSMRGQMVSTMYNLKNALYLRVNVFSMKALIGDTIFQDISYWRRDHHFMWLSEPREGLAICRAKVVPSFLSYFKTLGTGLTPGIETASSCSSVKHSTRLR